MSPSVIWLRRRSMTWKKLFVSIAFVNCDISTTVPSGVVTLPPAFAIAMYAFRTIAETCRTILDFPTPWFALSKTLVCDDILHATILNVPMVIDVCVPISETLLRAVSACLLAGLWLSP